MVLIWLCRTDIDPNSRGQYHLIGGFKAQGLFESRERGVSGNAEITGGKKDCLKAKDPQDAERKREVVLQVKSHKR